MSRATPSTGKLGPTWLPSPFPSSIESFFSPPGAMKTPHTRRSTGTPTLVAKPSLSNWSWRPMGGRYAARMGLGGKAEAEPEP